jgi:hypothetical protein
MAAVVVVVVVVVEVSAYGNGCTVPGVYRSDTPCDFESHSRYVRFLSAFVLCLKIHDFRCDHILSSEFNETSNRFRLSNVNLLKPSGNFTYHQV